MARQNRVDPYGRILAVPSRGMFMGNRGGRLHDSSGAIVRAQASRAWIICVTEFRGRYRPVDAGGYTALFFLDEATALAAGHRPCFECRHADATRFLAAHREATGRPRLRASDLDAALAAERRRPRARPGTGKIAYLADVGSLPVGTMVDVAGRPHLVSERGLLPWTPDGYEAPRPPVEQGWVLTPPTTVAVLARGYRPVLHPTATP